MLESTNKRGKYSIKSFNLFVLLFNNHIRRIEVTYAEPEYYTDAGKDLNYIQIE